MFHIVNDPTRDERISSFLLERIAAGDFPSAVYMVSRGASPVLADALGHAVRTESQKIPATLETIYDMASLTKPLVTGLLCAQRIERGELDLDTEVARLLPEFDRADKREITLRQLLTHTSGLPAWRPLYITTGGDPARALQAIAVEALEAAPGARVRYSDLGFITLGFLLERITKSRLADLARHEIFEPLKLRRAFINPERAWQTATAASETGNLYERQMCVEMQMEAAVKTKTEAAINWREHLIWGEAHDGNAHFLGGAAGHAGLFSDARDTLRLSAQFLPRHTELLKPETCALFRVNMTSGLEEARSLAWQLAATPGSTAGPNLSPDSFGHLGFTGTSCWIDAARDRAYILLTNRTHARSLPFVNINSVRRAFHTMASAALDEPDTKRRVDA
ncbi:MAG TPA: serine hydrolase domain-containing protein [Pyrinomonadaceae bacterium]